MKYNVVVFGVKDTSENIVEFINSEICPVDLVITISPEVTKKNQVSGYKGLSVLTEKYGIPVHESDSYFLTDDKTQKFLSENEFDIGISMGWQRLIPSSVLDRFNYGIYGFQERGERGLYLRLRREPADAGGAAAAAAKAGACSM